MQRKAGDCVGIGCVRWVTVGAVKPAVIRGWSHFPRPVLVSVPIGVDREAEGPVH